MSLLDLPFLRTGTARKPKADTPPPIPTAVWVCDANLRGDGVIYRLSVPFSGHRYIAVSGVALPFPCRGQLSETMVFPATARGVKSFDELWCCRPKLGHRAVLGILGYKLIRGPA